MLPSSHFRDHHTCSPIDRTVHDGHGAASYPEVTPLDGSPALRTLCIDRTCSHTTIPTPTSHKAVSSTRDSTSSNRARTRPQAVYGLAAASFLAQPRANTHASPSAAPRRLRVPRARATQAAAGQAAAQHRLGRTHRHSSSRNRMRSPLQLLRHSLRQRPFRPREREVAFVLDHRISSTNISVGRNALTDERFNVS